MSSYNEGWKFGCGIISAVMEMGVIDAEAELEFSRKDDKEYDQRQLDIKRAAQKKWIERVESLFD